MLRKTKHIVTSLALLLLAACAPHTQLKTVKPDIPLPDNYTSRFANESEVPKEFHRPWWDSFERPTLTQLIKKGFDHNQNVKQAYATLKQAQSTVIQTGTERMPQVDIDGDVGKNWRDGNEENTTSAIGTALSWEVDIFDRIGSSLRADQYTATARAEDVSTLKLSLSSDIATTYFNIVAAQQSLSLLRQQSQLDQELLDLLNLRLENGIGTNVDVLRQKARLADSQKLIPLAESDLAVFENRLDVLLGQAPDGLHRVPTDESLLVKDDLPPIGVPAHLLLNRPDLRSMTAEIFAADARIAEAIADRLPQITLDASFGYSDATTFSGPVAMLMGAFVQPLLDWGKRKAEVERNKGVYEEKLAAFTQRFLEAVMDVDNAIIKEDKQRRFLERLQKQRNILQETVNASQSRYQKGVDDYLPVIDALKELRQIQRDEITEKLELVTIRIGLFRALGGPIHLDQKGLKNE